MMSRYRSTWTIDVEEYINLNIDCARAKEERNEARKWARRMLREATIAQQNHVSAIQREMITGSKLFDRETRLTTLAKELGRVQRERDAEVERAVEAEAEIEKLKTALDEMGQCTIYNVSSEKVRLEKALDEIIARSTCQDISLQQHVVRLKGIACAARNVKLCCKEADRG